MSVTIAIESPRQPELIELFRQGDEFALALYPEDSCFMLDVSELEHDDVSLFVARAESTALGIAALVDRRDGTAELKRMFVTSESRGLGIARALLGTLEEHARAAGIHTIQLETGTRHDAAQALYEKLGYRHIPQFGQYIGEEFSVCMEKDLPR